jgi:hypothetical protein
MIQVSFGRTKVEYNSCMLECGLYRKNIFWGFWSMERRLGSTTGGISVIWNDGMQKPTPWMD